MAAFYEDQLMEQDPYYLAKVDAQRRAQATKQFSQLTPQELTQWQGQFNQTGVVAPDMATQQAAWERQRDYGANNFNTAVANRPAPIPTTNPMSMPSQTPTTGSQPSTPASPWDTQPKPVTQKSGVAPTAVTNAFQLPQGFNVRTGSTDPNDPTGQNQSVYGSNYFPGGLSGFEGVMNAGQFNALSPQLQGDYREALYRQHAGLPAPNQPGSPTAGTKPNSPNYDPLAPATAGNKPNIPITGPPGPPGGVPPGGPPTGPPGAPPPGGGQLQPTNQQYQFPNNFSFPAFNYNQVEDYKNNPAYQSQLKDSERALNRRLLSMGRSDSTGGINAFQTNERRLGAEFEQKAYERAVTEDNNAYGRARQQNMTEFDRANEINRLLYDRNYQERVLSYEQKFRENERQYGRAKAEEQLAYDRSWNEDAREYSYWKYLVDVGLRAAGAPAT